MTGVRKRTLLLAILLCVCLAGIFIYRKTSRTSSDNQVAHECTYQGLAYSQGAVIMTDDGRRRCDNGKWVPVE